MTMTIEVFETITLVSPDEWNRLTIEYPFANWHWLQASETLLGESGSRYVILSQNGAFQAGAVCSIQNRFHSRLLQSLLGWLPRHLPYVRCDRPLPLRSGLFFADPAQFEQLFPELLEAVKTVARLENALFYSFDHLLPADPAWPHLQALNFHRIEHISEATLSIHWASLEAYLEYLAPEARQEHLRVEAVLRQHNIMIETAVPSTEDLAALQRLVGDLALSKQKPHHFRQDLFSTAHHLLGQDFKIIVARQDNCAIGCVILLRSAHEWLVRWPGLDVEHEWSAEVYSAMLVACVEQVILAQGQRLYLGVMPHQTLKYLGATLEKRFGATAVRNRFLHWLGGRFLNITANPDAAQSITV
jgi:predicted N-acyltransferase